MLPIFSAMLVACSSTEPPGDDGLLDLRVITDEATGTVVTVEWTTDEPASSVVEYGFDDSYGTEREGWTSEDGLQHAVVFGGLDPAREWHWRARSVAGSETLVSADQVFEPPWAPVEIPEPVTAGWTDSLLLVPLFGNLRAVVIYNGYGHAVWWHIVGGEGGLTQVRPSLDGKAIILEGEAEEILRVPFAGGETLVPWRGDSHHDFLERPDGSLVILRGVAREVDGMRVQGDALIEIGPDGRERQVWDSWSTLDVPELQTLPWADEETLDWTHINSMAFDGEEYWLSSFTLECLLRINAQSGELTSIIGGTESDFKLVQGEEFGPQHSPVPFSEGFLIFDNHAGLDEDSESEVTEYVFGESETYGEVWSFGEAQGVSAVGLGNVEILPDDNRLIGWGTGGRVSVVSRAKDVVWQADFAVGTGVGFVHPVAIAPVP